MTRQDPLVWLPDDQPLLEFYRGTFDVAYIALHPFARVPGLDPLRCRHGSIVVERSEIPDDANLTAYLDQADAERARERLVDEVETDRRLKADGRIIAWREVMAACDLDDARHVHRALRTTIGGLRADLADEGSADRLIAFCNGGQIFRPTDSEFQPVMERDLVDLFARAGCDRVVLGDEFGDHDIPKPLDFLRGDAPWAGRPDWPPIWGVRRIYAEDRSMLAIVPWDQFFTVIAMTADRAARAGTERLFEGFWCSVDTTAAWLLDSPQRLLGSTD